MPRVAAPEQGLLQRPFKAGLHRILLREGGVEKREREGDDAVISGVLRGS